jgi:dihydrofolate synthase / folylpolyglutamate synthase
VDLIIQVIPIIQEKSVLAITSKILSLSQNRVIPINAVPDKHSLIQEEADYYLEGDYVKQYGVCLTIKNGILIPTAGIDESNANAHYILYPIQIEAAISDIWHALRAHYQIQDLGILLTDSHTTPLRRGVTGIALGWCGFKPLYNYIGTPDIHGRLLAVTQLNLVDSLASAAVCVMGEGNEQTPLVLITEIDKLVFQNAPPTDAELQSVVIPLEEDLYAPLLNSVAWIKR